MNVFLIILVIIFLMGPLIDLYEKVIYPYIMTRDMPELERDIWLEDYYTKLPDDEE